MNSLFQFGPINWATGMYNATFDTQETNIEKFIRDLPAGMKGGSMSKFHTLHKLFMTQPR